MAGTKQSAMSSMLSKGEAKRDAKREEKREEHATLAVEKDLWIECVEPTRQLSATSAFANESKSTAAGSWGCPDPPTKAKSVRSIKDLDALAAATCSVVSSRLPLAVAGVSEVAAAATTKSAASSKLPLAVAAGSLSVAPSLRSGHYPPAVHYSWLWFPYPGATATIDVRACFAELLAMFLFVVIGCGTACSQGSMLIVCLAFGLAITALAYSVGHHSGGQINCAVTLALVLGGSLGWKQATANVVCRLIGSLLAALLLAAIFPCEVDKTGTLGTNFVAEGYTVAAAFVAEVFGTFLLCFVVFESAVHPRSGAGALAPLAPLAPDDQRQQRTLLSHVQVKGEKGEKESG